MSSYDSDSPTDSVSSSSERRNLISPTSSIDSGEIYSNEVPLSRNPILLALLIGFIGYYFVRSNLTVTLSVILKSLPGVDKAEFGSILSVGYLFYASGKLISGPLIESYGPNKLFVGGLFLGILFNMVFVLVPVTLNKEENHIVNKNQALAFYGFAWGMNRLAQSVGWGSLIKIVSTKFPANIHGRVIGIASLSYGLGDVLVRVSIGLVLMAASNDKEILTPTGASFLWKKAFVFSIIMALLCMIPSYFKLVSPSQSIDSSEKKPKKVGFLDTLSYISTNPKFWVLLVVSPCLTLLRESLMVWLAVYLTDFLEIPESTAAILSMVFPLFGTFSTVVFGWIIDHLHPKRKGMIPTVALLGLSIILYSLSSSFFLKMESRTLSVFMECVSFSLAAFFLMGPYSYVEGVFALDLVSSKDGGVGIVLGIFNSVGYLGAILSGHTVGLMVERCGWPYVFRNLFYVSAASFLLFFIYLKIDMKYVR